MFLEGFVMHVCTDEQHTPRVQVVFFNAQCQLIGGSGSWVSYTVTGKP